MLRRTGKDEFSRKVDENISRLKDILGVGETFDVILREIRVAGKKAALVWVDGFIGDDGLQRALDRLLLLEPGDLSPCASSRLIREKINYAEVESTDSFEDFVTMVLAGNAGLVIDGENQGILIDVRKYPGRDPDEPDLERVIRGSRDGFVETLVFNTVLIRRRLRDPSLRAEVVHVGKRSKTDVALVYLKDIANLDLVSQVREKLKAINTDGVPMAEKTIEEFIVPRRNWFNPFPLVRFTERPDVAVVHLLEGHVLIIVDTSPSVIIIPATFFHHVQHAEEYREGVPVGVYVRWVRFIGMFVALIGPPLWVGFAKRPDWLPEFLKFIGPKEAGRIDIAVQFIVAEIGVDLIRIALIHTPNAIATALGFIGALVLGEMAVEVGLFTTETVLYTALAALGTFATPSQEFGLALRLSRLLFLVVVYIGGLPLLCAAFVLWFAYLATRRSFGVSYLWPLIPFNAGALWTILVRQPVPTHWKRPAVLKPQEMDRIPKEQTRRRQR
ncbi:MAG: spore germination protein [Bacillota bacterium]